MPLYLYALFCSDRSVTDNYPNPVNRGFVITVPSVVPPGGVGAPQLPNNPQLPDKVSTFSTTNSIQYG